MRKTGVHSAMVRLSSLSSNIDLDIVDDKERINSSLHGHLKNDDRARSTGLSFFRRPRRVEQRKVMTSGLFHFSDLQFHSLKIIPCSKQWKSVLKGVELLFIPESLPYDV